QMELAAQTARSFRNNLAIIEEGFRSGINGALEVRLARANVAGAEGRWEARKILLDETVRTLEVLLGRYPSFSLALANKLPVINRDVPPGLPSELLARRPDLKAAELRFGATDERVKQARKNLLPSIRLTVSGGTSTDEFREMLNGDFLVWNIASNLTTPIFQGGRLRAQVDVSLADQEGALADYAQIVLQAFQEVESALTAERLLVAQEIALQTAATESVEAEKLAMEQYRAGLVDIITLLETQRRSFDAQSALIETSNQRLQNRVGLYLALGGSFSEQTVTRLDNRSDVGQQNSGCVTAPQVSDCSP
ncbi:MAG: TolC family protein, partial [Gammaproteobacteria bacterium]